MIKNTIKQNLLEYHKATKKSSSLHNLKASVQSLADAVRYIESACEEIDNQNLVNKLVELKKHIMTDSGLGGGFNENSEPDVISKIQKIVSHLEKDLEKTLKKNNLPSLF